MIHSVWLIDRFRNGNILDKEEYNNNETLVLTKVGKNMAGDFRCRAINDFGAEFSEPAALIVLGKCLLLMKPCHKSPFPSDQTFLHLYSRTKKALCKHHIFSILSVKTFWFLHFMYELFQRKHDII